MKGEAANGCAIVRPPGHHAEPGMCCSVLQYVECVTMCSVRVVVHCNTFPTAVPLCDRLATTRNPVCVAVCCSVLQCVAVCCSVLQCARYVLQCTATRFQRLPGMHCSVLQFCHCVLQYAFSGCKGWLRLVGSFELQVSFAKEPYK